MAVPGARVLDESAVARRLGGGGTLADDLASTALAVARRFAAGATMWCVSPAWPEHASHVAVEFVHPVIVGKRALPAEVVDAVDPVGAVRSLARPGDILVSIAAASDPVVASLHRRAPAWGVDTTWIGIGRRPRAGAADHVLWVDDAGLDAVYSGGLTLLYHVLWELTHVCFEHPGLLNGPAEASDDTVCITCGDEGRLGEVVKVADGCLATVRTSTGLEEVDCALVGPLEAGVLVMIHAGTAIEKLEEFEDDEL